MGYYLGGTMPTVDGSVLGANSRVPVDTNLPQGADPQSGGMIPGTLPCPATQLDLTALAAGTKADATQLGYGINTIGTVAGANDSLLLPYAFPGAVCVVINTVATAIQVFGKGTDEIDEVATATGIEQAASARAIYFGIAGEGDGSDAGAWMSIGAAAP